MGLGLCVGTALLSREPVLPGTLRQSRSEMCAHSLAYLRPLTPTLNPSPDAPTQPVYPSGTQSGPTSVRVDGQGEPPLVARACLLGKTCSHPARVRCNLFIPRSCFPLLPPPAPLAGHLAGPLQRRAPRL
jgi:hypothetical protein